jgi:hypothetical protein
MHVHGKSWYQCLVSLCLFVTFYTVSEKENYPWIVSDCVSMSICEATISNLSRSFSVCVCVCVCVRARACDVCINTYDRDNQGDNINRD